MYGASRKWLGYWTISLCLLSTSLSYGEAPTPTESRNQPKKQAAKENKKPAPDKRGTDEMPLVIKVIPPDNSQKEPKEIPKEEKEHPPDYGWISDLLLALFTGGLFLATWLLWRATEKLVRGSEKTAERQLRAYMGIKEGHIAIKGGNQLSGIVVVKNCGQTPAYNVRAWCITGVFAPQETVSFRRAETVNTYGDIGHDVAIHLTISSQLFSPDKIAGIRNRTHPTFVWGKISYRDVFMKDWETEFRVSMGPDVGTDRWGLRPCEEGNKST